ncbi:MAG TPA: pectate lyase, partial [Candidatus Goldiibacteriota bacterium]|nr:pectate lyase [Candidatus Goldiibacteriota bacterium]
MKKILLIFSITFICSQITAEVVYLCSPVGWASQNGGTTGGGSAAAVTVTTLSALQTEASSSNARVIFVQGTMGSGVSTRVTVASNKTIIGLPGATLIGGFDVKNASNVIIRNMKIQGPGSVDVDGVDCITVSNSTNVWLDHLDISDGQDGNLDIVNASNYVTVSWCKFYYTSASQNHQFCNLIGNSDSSTSDRGKLKVTFIHTWWADGVIERMPRVRFGQVHVVNNLFTSSGNSYCVRAGIEAD